MVCEPPRQRQLLVRRRGSFFEDPFFRDAWDDYSHAVRRIVDRFNHGWVSPSERLQDSQYHSMYRTLRTARLNYSTHSARFKEEGDVYRLVMDVREFVGGDITVRTAGGTVSVRGKMEVAADPGGPQHTTAKAKGGVHDDDDKSSISSRSSSARTLHRRFTLPSDANCEKVESSLSRDAVLTIIIPKKTNVHYIPVSLEEDTNKENNGGNRGPRNGVDGLRHSGVKRPSDTPLESTRKKSQDEPHISRRRKKTVDEQKERDGERQLRRKSKGNASEGVHSGELDHESRIQQEETEGKRRRKNEEKENERKLSGDRLSRRRESKYEDVCEINIPIRIDKNEPIVKVFRPSSTYEPIIHNIEIEKELSSSMEDITATKSQVLQPSGNQNLTKENKGETKVNAPVFREKYGKTGNINLESIFDKKSNKIHKDNETNNISNSIISSNPNTKLEYVNHRPLGNSNQGICPEIKGESKDVIKVATGSNNEIKGESKDVIKVAIGSNNQNKVPNYTTLPEIINKKYDIPVFNIGCKANGQLLSKRATISSEKSEDESDEDDVSETDNTDLNEDKKQEMNEMSTSEGSTPSSGVSESTKNKLEAPKMNDFFQRPSPPPSPGSREVKVEKRQSLMEDDIFKDCWSDFSNTLQDVLSRLQELSSELGQSKLLATTPIAEDAQIESKESSSNGVHVKSADVQSSSNSPEGKPLNSDHRNTSHNNVGSVGGREGVTKDKSAAAHTTTGHGHSVAYVLDEKRKLDCDRGKEITQAALKGRFYQPSEASQIPLQENLDHIAIQETFKAPRPHSLTLRSVACPQNSSLSEDVAEESPSRKRSSSLLVNDLTTGSLLPSLRKNSPVEALQESFLQRHGKTSLKEGKECFVPVEVDPRRAVPVGGVRAEDRRSSQLSPSDIQLNATSGCSESRINVSDASRDRSPSGDELICDSDSNEESDNEGVDPPSSLNYKKTSNILNDLNTAAESLLQDQLKRDTLREIRTFAPNIDASPESNLSDESESSNIASDGVVEGFLSFPVRDLLEGVKEKRRLTDFPSDKDSSRDSDVTGTRANERCPEIPSDDVMGCERPLASTGRLPSGVANKESLRNSRLQKPREALLRHEQRGHADSGRGVDGSMGGVISRGRKGPPANDFSESLSGSPSSKTFQSPSATSSASHPLRGVKKLTVEEKPVPPYVRQRSEPSKRYSGFAHVNSDNVRRMRDVWGSKQDTKAPTQPHKPQRLPPSPTRGARRLSSEISTSGGHHRRQQSESPRCSPVPSTERRASSPFRKASPSPTRRPPSPTADRSRMHSNNDHKLPSERFMRGSSPSPVRTQVPQKPPSNPPYKATSPPYGSSLRRGSEERDPPTPPSYRRSSYGTNESPSRPSSVERPKSDYIRRPSDEKPRAVRTPLVSPTRNDSSAKTPKTHSFKVPSEPPPASRVHHKIFKRLRDASLQPDSEALCFKEEEDKYTMVLDVVEYVPGEVEVLQDDKLLTVKGRVETREEGGHLSVKTFDRVFNIPKNSREEDIDSALSKDGILTIYVPKKKERVIKIELVD